MKATCSVPQAGPSVRLALLGCELEGVEVGGLVAGIHVAQPLEALHQQSRADEQHQRERGLPDHQHVATPVTAGRGSRAPFTHVR